MKKSIVFVLFTIFVLTSCTTKNDVKNDVKIEEKEQVKYVTTMIVEEKGFFEQIKLP
jgi:PBP1b-binding outer membrane lipoprotein LpoB